MGTVSSAFKGAWDKMVRAGIFSEHSNPKATVTDERLAAFFERAGVDRLDVAAVEHAADLERHMDSRGSNAGYVAGTIDLIRSSPLTRAQADERYARKGEGGSGVTFTAEQARQVARDEIGRATVRPG